MKDKPLVSVVIPVYKTPENYLRECIESVLKQTIQDFEMILVDDGSPDKCGLICEEYARLDSRIHVIHQKNAGVSAARNTGLANVKGKYLTFLDADDMLSFDAWTLAINMLQQYNADCVVFGWNDFTQEGKFPRSVTDTTQVVTAKDFQKQIASDNFLCGGGYPWNKIWDVEKICLLYGTLPKFNTEIYTYEDKLWILEVAEKLTNIVLMPDILYNYRFLPSSLTQDEQAWRHRQFNAYDAYDLILDTLQDKNNEAYRGALKFYFHFCFKDLTIIYPGRIYEKSRYKRTKKRLWNLSRRIRPGELKELKYNLAWIYFLLLGWI